MTAEKTVEAGEKLAELIASPVYRENLDFWERAWAPVKRPYTEMPDLPYMADILAYLKEGKAKRVLDLGCGSGWLSIYLARQDFQVTGLDISAQALFLAKTWAEQESLVIQFDTGDIAEIQYAPQSFDAVVANSIFEHLTYELADLTMKRLQGLLIPGGSFVGCFDKVGGGPGEYFELSDGTHVYTDKGRKGMLLRYFDDEELKRLFAGWTIDRFETLESGSRFVCAHT
ncbi:MAG TPA: class I SAM-dependent methyltransferase [Planktothrix sp.]|jgi:SAM-dependent methyltransferase